MAQCEAVKSSSQSICRWCTRHMAMRDVSRCLIDDKMRLELRRFAQQCGKRWRANMRKLWSAGDDAGIFWMRVMRNMVGPSRLDRVRPPVDDSGEVI